MRHFLNISDLSSQFLREIIDEAKIRKSKRRDLNKSAADFDQTLAGKSMIMIFEKPSTRTRISFDIAAKQLGGSSIILNPDVIHYGKGDESIKDTAKVLSGSGADLLIFFLFNFLKLASSIINLKSLAEKSDMFRKFFIYNFCILYLK